jgi:hypothetical protein
MGALGLLVKTTSIPVILMLRYVKTMSKMEFLSQCTVLQQRDISVLVGLRIEKEIK